MANSTYVTKTTYSDSGSLGRPPTNTGYPRSHGLPGFKQFSFLYIASAWKTLLSRCRVFIMSGGLFYDVRIAWIV